MYQATGHAVCCDQKVDIFAEEDMMLPSAPPARVPGAALLCFLSKNSWAKSIIGT